MLLQNLIPQMKFKYFKYTWQQADGSVVRNFISIPPFIKQKRQMLILKPPEKYRSRKKGLLKKQLPHTNGFYIF